jgi:hypothetical protein
MKEFILGIIVKYLLPTSSKPQTLKEIESSIRKSQRTLDRSLKKFEFYSKSHNSKVSGVEALKICRTFSLEARIRIINCGDNYQHIIFYLKNLTAHMALVRRAKQNYDHEWGQELSSVEYEIGIHYRKLIKKLFEGCNYSNFPGYQELIQIHLEVELELYACQTAVFITNWMRIQYRLKDSWTTFNKTFNRTVDHKPLCLPDENYFLENKAS